MASRPKKRSRLSSLSAADTGKEISESASEEISTKETSNSKTKDTTLVTTTQTATKHTAEKPLKQTTKHTSMGEQKVTRRNHESGESNEKEMVWKMTVIPTTLEEIHIFEAMFHRHKQGSNISSITPVVFRKYIEHKCSEKVTIYQLHIFSILETLKKMDLPVSECVYHAFQVATRFAVPWDECKILDACPKGKAAVSVYCRHGLIPLFFDPTARDTVRDTTRDTTIYTASDTASRTAIDALRTETTQSASPSAPSSETANSTTAADIVSNAETDGKHDKTSFYYEPLCCRVNLDPRYFTDIDHMPVAGILPLLCFHLIHYGHHIRLVS